MQIFRTVPVSKFARPQRSFLPLPSRSCCGFNLLAIRGRTILTKYGVRVSASGSEGAGVQTQGKCAMSSLAVPYRCQQSQTRAYRWDNPPKIGWASTRPALLASCGIGACFPTIGAGELRYNIVFEAGRDGFWLARRVHAGGIEPHVIQRTNCCSGSVNINDQLVPCIPARDKAFGSRM
jgi:hypothetical protein